MASIADVGFKGQANFIPRLASHENSISSLDDALQFAEGPFIRYLDNSRQHFSNYSVQVGGGSVFLIFLSLFS